MFVPISVTLLWPLAVIGRGSDPLAPETIPGTHTNRKGLTREDHLPYMVRVQRSDHAVPDPGTRSYGPDRRVPITCSGRNPRTLADHGGSKEDSRGAQDGQQARVRARTPLKRHTGTLPAAGTQNSRKKSVCTSPCRTRARGPVVASSHGSRAAKAAPARLVVRPAQPLA